MGDQLFASNTVRRWSTDQIVVSKRADIGKKG